MAQASQVLVIGDDSRGKIEAGKVQTVAKFLGQSLSTRAASPEEQHLQLPCLKTDTHHHSGGNVIAKLLVAVLGHSLYPQPPYSPDKRIRAAQIDAWIDYSTLQLRQGTTKKRTEAIIQSLLPLEKALAAQTYIVSDRLSLADIILAFDLKQPLEQVLKAEAHTSIPSVLRWHNTISYHPNVAEYIGPLTNLPAANTASSSSHATPPLANGHPPEGVSRGGTLSSAATSASQEAADQPSDAKPKGKAAKGGKLAKNDVAKGQKKGGEKKEKQAQAPKAAQGQGGGKKKETKLGLAHSKTDNFGDWYSEVCVESEMISYYDVSGCYILRPWAFRIWEILQRWFDDQIKDMGFENAYFPLFITEEALKTEKDHVEGFAAEVAWVTKSGESEMERPIAIRPTSETVMYPYYSQWVRSHRDLPLKLNQWNAVVRWEFKHPTPFIRSREFLWQEGHSAFATQQEAEQEVYDILNLYEQVYEDFLAVPVCKGTKSSKEKFAGALFTTTVEAFVPMTGKGIQGATSHCLGQNFSKMFHIEYETEGGGKAFAWQNSWAFTTRVIGVMIMVHGDDKGLVMPPKVAPQQVVVIPIPNSKMAEDAHKALVEKAKSFVDQLKKAGVRVTFDPRDNYTPGWKYNHWELKGVPIRLEVGPKDMEKEAVMLARRDNGQKESVSWSDVTTRIPQLLEQIQKDMLSKARNEFDSCIKTVTSWDDFVPALDEKKMVLAPWCDEEEVEDDVKRNSASGEAMGAKTLCIPLQQPDLPEGTKCFRTGKPAKNWVLWGRSY